MMGLTDSTYHACQTVKWDKSIAMGDRIDLNNPISWENVVLNSHGTKGYDFQQPMVFNQRVYGLLADDLFIYVDDRHPIGSTETLCWEAYRR